ncbi:GFA family protein [Aurantimonas endophytica]|uniref:CENP-V/GFA domain-containing protein n=1 Tax=Aurantimonas endophytica TaxID=1522175 RepID=A0A7W6MMX6_9HYPH|nr:GFA family protein [Aurantimonas endophytica]MBB4001249.1 hypothetical protein [Aurantimonas endophytica]MCO6403102.1 GFA family protein [Aurantimonas endophytica]
MTVRTGGCNCGAVRLEIRGEPIRVGLCHCTVCRKETGGPYLAFVVFPEAAVTAHGETRSWADDFVRRHFCPTCGSRLFSVEGNGEVEVRLGCLDAAPTDLAPTYENWVVHRESWLPELPGAGQNERDRNA